MKNELSSSEFFCVENMLAMSLEMLHELDRNTMQYIIDEQKKELEQLDKEIEERDKQIKECKEQIKIMKELIHLRKENKRLLQEVADLKKS